MTESKRTSHNNYQDLINQELIANLCDQFSMNFFVIDKNGYYICKNGTLSNVVGHDVERADLVSPEAWETSLEVMRTRSKQIIEEEFPEGNWFLSIKTPLIKDDEVVGVMGIAIDITKQKLAERAKREFVRNMEHDLRTPFCGIQGISQMLFEQETDLTKKEWLGYVCESANSLLSLMNQVLELTSVGSCPIQFSYFNIKEEIQGKIELLTATIKHKGLALSVICPDEVIYNDKVRIGRILLSLLSNAIKFTDHGEIVVTVQTQPCLKIAITDTGIGIPKEAFNNIFDKFYKCKESNQSSQLGTGAGLGLYIAKQYANDINGTITVESELGKGATFSFVAAK